MVILGRLAHISFTIYKKMVLKVLPAEETDMYRSAVIEHEAYKRLETNQILFPGSLPPDVLDRRADELKAQSKEPNTFYYKVIDTELEGEQRISFAKWYVDSISARRRAFWD